MSSRSDSQLQNVYELLKNAKPLEAKKELESILSQDLENTDVLFALKVATYWANEMKVIDSFSNGYEKGEQLITKWKHFYSLLKHDIPQYESLLFFIQQGVFRYCLDSFSSILKESRTQDKADVYARMGLCYKKLGDYTTSLRYLKDANKAAPKKADILAQMADCYALCGEEIPAKALFREAFFIEPKQIDLELLESELFYKLHEIALASKQKDSNLAAWIPIYGVLYGILTIKRELKSLEVGQLKQAIYALEKEYKEAEVAKDDIKALLINHYFWLIDHYIAVNEGSECVHEVLLKIKIIDSTIYEQYCA